SGVEGISTDDKGKQKAMKAVSSVSGINSIAMDVKEKKMTVIGEVDPVCIVGKLRKSWHTELDFVGPPKEPEKKETTTTVTEIVNAYPPYHVVETVAEENYPSACCVIS
ncbi:heavy metal-associated isoprenylated plant protein 39-like, partial [Macadamia integrifolia]|uniref:heavy metal-associated isoprenylated plant protein 39-like n=1 Tax=Macadamia integrifolia TaxID=60698 RepID=UPI001C4EA6BD